jgi:1,2-diacylglycerol 3-beta-galactosyltransferase
MTARPPATTMAAMSPMSTRRVAPVPVLFLVADTGGGHRSAARAVAGALLRACPGRFAPVLLDPLSGPGSSWLLRRVTRLYGPVIRYAPRVWGAAYRASDSEGVMWLLRRTLLRLADRRVIDAAAGLRPAAVVSFHPLATQAAVRAARHGTRAVPAVTVVTDLVSVHTAWRAGRADRIVVPSADAGERCRPGGTAPGRCTELGLPVAAEFSAGPPLPRERLLTRRALGVGGRRFLVVVTGGGEGSGPIARQVSALLGHFNDVEVAAICGRNRRLRRRLSKLAARSGGRLAVRGFVTSMAGWLRCADVIVTKAGPSTIAEAACCGAPLLLTSHLPGQEDGNTELVVSAGAGRHVPRVTDLLREVGRLRADPAALDAMRAASARLARPRAAAEIAETIAELAAIPAAPPLAPAGRPAAARSLRDAEVTEGGRHEAA